MWVNISSPNILAYIKAIHPFFRTAEIVQNLPEEMDSDSVGLIMTQSDLPLLLVFTEETDYEQKLGFLFVVSCRVIL